MQHCSSASAAAAVAVAVLLPRQPRPAMGAADPDSRGPLPPFLWPVSGRLVRLPLLTSRRQRRQRQQHACETHGAAARLSSPLRRLGLNIGGGGV